MSFQMFTGSRVNHAWIPTANSSLYPLSIGWCSYTRNF